MKNVTLILVVIILFLGCFSMLACGEKENVDTQEVTETQSSSTQKADSSNEGITWDDIPLYSGAKQVQKGSWFIPPAEGDYSKVEWRYYEVSDDKDSVSSFYKKNMPGEGWEEMGWMETPEMSWSIYNKNNEQDAAMIWVSGDNGKTILALMRASQ